MKIKTKSPATEKMKDQNGKINLLQALSQKLKVRRFKQALQFSHVLIAARSMETQIRASPRLTKEFCGHDRRVMPSLILLIPDMLTHTALTLRATYSVSKPTHTFFLTKMKLPVTMEQCFVINRLPDVTKVLIQVSCPHIKKFYPCYLAQTCPRQVGRFLTTKMGRM